jgi:hypothetical protein
VASKTPKRRRIKDNQKERALAFLAGHGFSFGQFATNVDVRTLWGTADPFVIKEWNQQYIWEGIFTSLVPVGVMVISAFGMWDAYRALTLSSGKSEEVKVQCEDALASCLFFGVLVILATMGFVGMKGFMSLLPWSRAGA